MSDFVEYFKNNRQQNDGTNVLHQIHSCTELIESVAQWGFLPLLESGIRGYCAEGLMAEECRFTEFADGSWEWPLWQWKGAVLREGNCTYGKFFAGKAGFVSLAWWPDLINWRRSQHPVPEADTIEDIILNTLRDNESMITRELRAACGLKMAIKFGPEQSEKIAAVIRSMKTMSNARRIAALLRLILLVAEDQVADVVGKIEELDKNERLRRQVDTYITCNVHRDFKLDDIAAHMNMKPSSFCVFFKKLTGKTFVTYLNEYRMERICKQLRETDAPVSEICYDNGFKNIPYFNRTFKRMMGVNPSEYRAEMNGTIETEG